MNSTDGPNRNAVLGHRTATRVMSSEDENSPLISENNGSLSTVGGASMGRGRKFLVTLCILVTELCERLTFYGLTANLLLFTSSELKLASPWPSTINYLFQGTCYLIPLLGGWLADTYMGRFNTIYASSLLYVVGTLLLAAVSMRDDMVKQLFNVKSIHNKTMRLVYFVLSLVMIAFGTGGIKANVSPFGADQVQREGPKAVQAFFNWFYWFINIGSLIAYTVVVWVQQSNVFYGYCITAGTMFLGVIAFLAGRNKYLTKSPGGSQLSETAKIIREAIRNRRQNAGAWLDGAKNSFGGKFSEAQVEDVKALLRVIAVFIFFIAYWTIYSQMQTTFLIQATYMKLKLENFTVPAASLSIFDIVAVLTLIPIMDHVVYPLLSYCGIRFTPLRRIGVGMLFAAASVIVAGVIEIERRNTWHDGGFEVQKVFDENRNASSLSIFWQVPQFILIGSSEVLTSITGLEFAYSQAPKCLQGLVMGAFLVTSGLGNYVANLLVVIVRAASNNDWYPENDPNQGHLEYFFFLLAGLMLVNFVVFLYVASSYKYKAAPKRTEEIFKDTSQPADGDPAV
ncbi:solute carrier family 15 member 4-like isoform X2 [Oculina patagonica]